MEINDTGRPFEDERSHLLRRLMLAGDAALSDRELLELLLAPSGQAAFATPLLQHFGCLRKIVQAEEAAFSAIAGADHALVTLLRAMGLVAGRLARAEVADRPVIDAWSRLIEYLQLTSGGKRTEEFRVLYLDHAHGLIADEVMFRGTVNHTPCYPREVVRRALELDAGAMIIVHNHPCGDTQPSPGDVEQTAKLMQIAGSMGITLHDHVIVAASESYSFRSHGLLGAT